MASQGPNNGSTFEDVTGSGNVAWSNPSNAQLSDNSYATSAIKGNYSDYLKATGFGFSIPTGATINGIAVDVERKMSSSAGTIWARYVKMVKAGTIQGNNNWNSNGWPTSDTYETYGSSTDKWGLTWTPAQINASDFGFAYMALEVDSITTTGSVDHIRITVYYTAVVAYTLSAEAGSYVKTGQDAGLKAARKITAAPGSYALTGQSIDLRLARKMAAGTGSYSLAGQDAGLKAARKITAAPGSYALTGQSVDLKLARKIAAGTGSYSLAGQDAVLRAIRKMAAEGGSYVLAGQDANLGIGQHYILVAEAGSYGEPYSKIFVTLDGRIYKKMENTYLRLA